MYLQHGIHHKKKINDYENIYVVNPLYLSIGEADDFIEDKNESKYLIFDATNENKKVLRNTQNFRMGLKLKLRQ